MRKLLLSAVALLALCGSAISQPYGTGVGPGIAPCAYTNCKVTTLAIGGATIGTDALAINGTSTFTGNIALNGQIVATGSIFAGASSLITFNTRGVLTSPAVGTIQFGQADAAAPVAQTIMVQNVVSGTSNTAGANTIVNLSVGTGTGIGGNLIINGAPHSTTGSTQNALSPILTLNGDTLAATFGGTLTGSITNGFAIGGAGTTTGVQIALYNTGLGLASAAPIYWTGGNLNGAPVTGLSADASAGVVDVGTGAQGSIAGSLKLASITGSGTYTFTTAASGIILKQGANGRVGTFVANGTSAVAVANTSVAISDNIVISLNTPGGTVGVIPPAIISVTAGTGFSIKAQALDTSTYNYAIIKNAP